MLTDRNLRPLLELNHVSTEYESNNPAIYGISFDVYHGEIVSILGTKGSGKSTILRVLAGLLPVHTGRILYNDREITGIHPGNAFRIGIAYVPEDVNLFPKMTVYENLEVASYGKNLDFRDSLDYILQFFPILRNYIKTNAGQLKASEQRLLEIARALLWKPRLLLIDEPSLNLSSSTRGEVFETIQRLNSELELTVLMTEPHTHLRISMCERAYILKNGHIIYEGVHDELLANLSIMHELLKN